MTGLMKMNESQYKKRVVDLALERRETVCLDTLDRSWEEGLLVEDAVDRIVLDTDFWEGRLL